MNLEIIGKTKQQHSFPIYKFKLNAVEDVKVQQENFIKTVRAVPKLEIFAEVYYTSVLPLQANYWHTIEGKERSNFTLIHTNEFCNNLQIKFNNDHVIDIDNKDCILFSSILSPKIYSDISVDIFISTCFIYYQYNNELPETITE